MIHFKVSKRLIILLFFSTLFLSFNNITNKLTGVSSTVKISFINTVKNSRIVLNDSIYSNPFEEKYTISKLRYYVTNVSLHNALNAAGEKNSYHLIDESKEESQTFSFNLSPGTYNSLVFLLGVDSLHNVSGAQSDDLDPTKDMFWTWNSGYVMAKMEGNSPSSKLVNNKYEFHIGGYAGTYNVIKKIHLDFIDGALDIKDGKTVEIIVDADINTWWSDPNDIKIAEHANITSPGKFALAISDNYAKMFHIEKIITQ